MMETNINENLSGSINELKRQRRKVEVHAPATIANLGPGFDILGMAFATPHDVIHAEWSAEPGIQIGGIVGDEGRLPLDPAKNTAGIAAIRALQTVQGKLGESVSDFPLGVVLYIEKGLPLASGLGSSAASAAGGAVAISALFGDVLDRAELLDAALEGEAFVSGRHADNVAPALWGGITLITGLTPEQILPLPIPPSLICVLGTPDVAVPTAQARAVLPKEVPLKSTIAQTAAVAGLIRALYTNDLIAFGKAAEQDCIIEPARQHLMPGLYEVRKAAAGRGALGTVISGAGPTLCSFCDDESIAVAVAESMREIFDGLKIGSRVNITRPSLDGVTVR